MAVVLGGTIAWFVTDWAIDLQEDVRQLRSEVQQLQGTPQSETDALPTPVPTRSATLPGPTTPFVDPMNNICDRTPAVQQVILNTLQVTLCEVISRAELYRIEELHDRISTISVKGGDFGGLVNLRELELVITEPPPPIIFADLASLQELKLSVIPDTEGPYQLRNGTFEGLVGLGRLVLNYSTDGKEYCLDLSNRPLANLDALVDLETRKTCEAGQG